MPLSFPDMQSLRSRAELRGFRQPFTCSTCSPETEDAYRIAFADFMQGVDPCESMEIRTSKGWDEWDQASKTEMVVRLLDDKADKPLDDDIGVLLGDDALKAVRKLRQEQDSTGTTPTER